MSLSFPCCCVSLFHLCLHMPKINVKRRSVNKGFDLIFWSRTCQEKHLLFSYSTLIDVLLLLYKLRWSPSRGFVFSRRLELDCKQKEIKGRQNQLIIYLISAGNWPLSLNVIVMSPNLRHVMEFRQLAHYDEQS